MPEQHNPQVSPDHYQESYDHRRRFLSYWNQIDHVRRSQAKNLLEVGIGNGFLTRYLREKGYKTHTVDFDERLSPDTVASVTELPFDDQTFDVVCCFETLEHLPFEEFEGALRELGRVSQGKVLISLPDVTPYFRLSLGYKYLKTLLSIRWDWPLFRSRQHRWDGQHHWEIGKRGYLLARVREAFETAGLRIVATHRDYEDPFHRFFVCEVRR